VYSIKTHLNANATAVTYPELLSLLLLDDLSAMVADHNIQSADRLDRKLLDSHTYSETYSLLLFLYHSSAVVMDDDLHGSADLNRKSFDGHS
jgi:hypothetical protein